MMPDAWTTIRRDAKLIGSALRARREAAGDTLTDMSVLTGIAKPSLSQIENGIRIPSADEALALTRIYPQGVLQRHQAGGAGVGGASLRNVPPKARTGDPSSSHQTVASIDADVGLAGAIIDLALKRGPLAPWDDMQMTRMLQVSGRDHQRNVIARARGRVERDGLIVRVGMRYSRSSGRDTLHFVHADYHQETP